MTSFYNRNLNSTKTAPIARRCPAIRPAVANWGGVVTGKTSVILNQVHDYTDSRLRYRMKPEQIS